MLRQCQEIVRQHSPEVVQVVSAYHMSGLQNLWHLTMALHLQEQRLEEFACDWMPILAEHQANQRGLANYMVSVCLAYTSSFLVLFAMQQLCVCAGSFCGGCTAISCHTSADGARHRISHGRF